MTKSRNHAARAAAVAKIVESRAAKKLVMAGPGTGKTTLFESLILAAKKEDSSLGPSDFLVITFVGSLTADLQQRLGKLAKVCTMHEYCRELIGFNIGAMGVPRRHAELVRLIKQDWQYLNGSPAPQFANAMRRGTLSREHWAFYTERAAYYDAFADDETIHRAFDMLSKWELSKSKRRPPSYRLVLVDEFQDFNKLEADFIDLLARHSPIVIAGDDDQALYGQLRGASWDHIRQRAAPGSSYEMFSLPFCSRCPEAIVGAVGDIIGKAASGGSLKGRVPKPFVHFGDAGPADAPQIDWVTTAKQSDAQNGFGEYVADVLKKAQAKPSAAVKKAMADAETVALVIGHPRYLKQVRKCLEEAGLPTVPAQVRPKPGSNAHALLAENPRSNLGWRIVLQFGYKDRAAEFVRAAGRNKPLADVVGRVIKEKVRQEVDGWKRASTMLPTTRATPAPDFRIECLSVERSKGKAAPYIFLVGLSSDAKKGKPPRDLDICRFIVGLTRTRSLCTLLTTKAVAAGKRSTPQKPFEPIGWIDAKRINPI